METNTAIIRTALNELRDLPTPVHDWRIREGLDATDDPAVWVWIVLDLENTDPDALHRLKAMVRAAVRKTECGLWPYVLVRGVDEAEDPA